MPKRCAVGEPHNKVRAGDPIRVKSIRKSVNNNPSITKECLLNKSKLVSCNSVLEKQAILVYYLIIGVNTS